MFSVLLDSIRQKFSGWKAKPLSLAGGLILLKHVISSMTLHISLVSPIPKSICKSSERPMRISCCITNGLSSLVIYLILMPGMCCALEAFPISGVLWSGINSLSLPILASLGGFSRGKPQPLCGFKALVSLLFQGALCVCCRKSLRSTSSFCVSLLPFFGTGFLTLLASLLLHCFQPTSCACAFCWQQEAWLPSHRCYYAISYFCYLDGQKSYDAQKS